jgi:hypothetical protein
MNLFKVNLFTPKSLEVTEIENMLQETDLLFTPNLSLELSIKEYSQKLFNNANVFVFRTLEEKIGGYLFYYLNKDFLYIALICSVTKGGGKFLLNNLKSQATSHSIPEIRLEVDERNEKAIGFYFKEGFEELHLENTKPNKKMFSWKSI